MRSWAMSMAAALAIAGVSDARAGVSLKNGNYNIGYTDVTFDGGMGMQISRFYNSKSGFKGVFGWAWGMEYEVYLVPQPDRTVVVHEYGGGAANTFYPDDYSARDVDRMVDAIVAAARKSGDVTSEQAARDLAARVHRDPFARRDEWEKYLKKGIVAPPEIPARLVSKRYSHQVVEPGANGGYVRTFSNGRIERYNRRGQLVRVGDQNGNYIAFRYDKRGRMVEMTDDVGRSIALSYTSRGRVSGLRTSKGRARYRYDKHDRLIYSKDVSGNSYRYEYDARHNLTGVVYADGSTMEITYYRRDMHENVRSVRDRDGTLTVYGYRWSPDSSRRWISVEVFSKNSRLISRSDYRYEFERKVSGETYQSRMRTSIDGDVTDTTYDPNGRPLRIERHGQVTSFEYDRYGNVTRKETPTEITALTYHPELHKVTRVERTSKVTKSASWSKFEYDGKGNLVFAESSQGKKATLTYDAKGRIATMTDHTGQTISFTYNKASKPTVIDAKGLGSIKVTYTSSGEIKKVDSTGGRQIALKVTSAFQDILDLIRPAGVSLSF